MPLVNDPLSATEFKVIEVLSKAGQVDVETIRIKVRPSSHIDLTYVIRGLVDMGVVETFGSDMYKLSKKGSQVFPLAKRVSRLRDRIRRVLDS